MVQRISRGEQQSISSVPWMVNGGRRILLAGLSLAANPTASSSPSNLAPIMNPPSSGGLHPSHPHVNIFIVVLICALICFVFLNFLMLCMPCRRDAAGNVKAVLTGLDAKTLASLPVLTFKAGESSEAWQPTALECTICLSEFTEDERLRLLPKCSHSFHIECIDMWLQSHISCPVCRAAIAAEDCEA